MFNTLKQMINTLKIALRSLKHTTHRTYENTMTDNTTLTTTIVPQSVVETNSQFTSFSYIVSTNGRRHYVFHVVNNANASIQEENSENEEDAEMIDTQEASLPTERELINTECVLSGNYVIKRGILCNQ